MKKQILLLLLILTINIQPQDDWLKANLDNQWQFILNENNTDYTLFIGKFIDTVKINDTLYYEFNFQRFDNNYLRYDSISNSIMIYCYNNSGVHCDFQLTPGNYSNLIRPGYFIGSCVTGVSLEDDTLYIGNKFYQTKRLQWHDWGTNYQSSTIKYSNGIGISYYRFVISGNYGGSTKTYSLYQCLIDGAVIKDTLSMEIIITPLSLITSPNLQMIFKVAHPRNIIFPSGSTKKSLLMIDTVWVHSFYEKNGDTLQIEKTRAGWLLGTENFLLIKQMNMNLLSQGYSFNYRIEAIDKGLSPNKAYSPENGYYKAYLDTTISVDYTTEKLMDYELEQNYPNPFNSTTKIRFFVPKEDDIVIDIYDVLGQQVIRLFEERVTAGRYEVELSSEMINSMNSSGVYFYRMRSSEKMITKKMLIQK